MDTTNPSATVKCWVELYSDRLYDWALYKCGKQEIAEDLVQDMFLIAYQSFAKFEGKSEPLTWLYGILNNRIADYFRKMVRQPVVSESTLGPDPGSALLESLFDESGAWRVRERPTEWTEEDPQLLDNEEFRSTLQNCLEGLPQHWMATVRLKYLEGKKGEVICQELGIAPTNFWQILHRSKLQLRKCLELHWFKK